jgi:flagellar biosynthesis/type III secretory pathway M-ring protein FliF/YscJ
VPIAIGAGGALFVVIVALALMMRRARKRHRAAATATNAELPQVVFPVPVAELERAVDAGALPAGVTAADARSLPPGKPTSERVAETVAGDVERAAAVLTAWLAESPVRTLQPGAK